jgi:pyrimidine operon attenuation protein/uracil phosphoribosyltransferase
LTKTQLALPITQLAYDIGSHPDPGTPDYRSLFYRLPTDYRLLEPYAPNHYICPGTMQKKLILDSDLLDITISRLCQQVIEDHNDFSDTVILGMQPRGIFLAELIHQQLEKDVKKTIPLGYLDTTFHRDDFRRRQVPLKANETRIPFIIEGKKVVLVDDVLFTGRTIRAALDAMIAFGRPAAVELLVLIDRKYNRELPIAAHYVGKVVNTLPTQRVLVELKAQGHKQNKIWLINKD